MINIEFVAASHNEDILNANLLRSPILKHYGLTTQKGFTNIPKAYNEAVTFSEMVCWIHHDVYLPPSFEQQLYQSLYSVPQYWEVLGVAGVFQTKQNIRGHVRDRGTEWGSPNGLPAEVTTLDDMLLITKAGQKFDEQFSQDFYGPDICVGRKCFAINAFCHHNSHRVAGHRGESFYKSQELFRQKHINSLPIACTYAYVS